MSNSTPPIQPPSSATMASTDVAEAYKDVIERFLGEDKPMRFVDAEKAGFFKRLFGGK